MAHSMKHIILRAAGLGYYVQRNYYNFKWGENVLAYHIGRFGRYPDVGAENLAQVAEYLNAMERLRKERP